MEVKIASDFCDTDVIVKTIYREIDKAEFIFCEISECNRNVFFEMGYAQAHKKNIIPLCKEKSNVKLFDFAHERWIKYSMKKPEAMQARLVDTIETIRGNR